MALQNYNNRLFSVLKLCKIFGLINGTFGRNGIRTTRNNGRAIFSGMIIVVFSSIYSIVVVLQDKINFGRNVITALNGSVNIIFVLILYFAFYWKRHVLHETINFLWNCNTIREHEYLLKLTILINLMDVLICVYMDLYIIKNYYSITYSIVAILYTIFCSLFILLNAKIQRLLEVLNYGLE